MIKVFEAFAGYGSQAMALKRLKENYPGFNYEVVGISEIDKYAIKAYNAVHGETKNFGDISKIDWNEVPDFDLFTYSFPCVDVSTAGHQKGLSEGDGTRSSLLWECRKAIAIKRPKYLLLENVKNLVSKKFIADFEKWCTELESYGYKNFYKVLKASDYGVPQSRERVYMISTLSDKEFVFPEPYELKKRFGDILEDSVDEKYFLPAKLIENYINKNKTNKEKGYSLKFETIDVNGISRAVTTKADRPNNSNFVKVLFNTNPSGRGAGGRVFDTRYLASTITTNKGEGARMACIEKAKEVANTLKEIAESSKSCKCDVTISPDLSIRPYRLDKKKSGVAELQTDYDGSVASTVTSRRPNLVYGGSTGFMVRKTTPRECFRLMDVDDSDIDKIIDTGISNTQMYKLAGNSIVVNVLYHIFRKLFINSPYGFHVLEEV